MLVGKLCLILMSSFDAYIWEAEEIEERKMKKVEKNQSVPKSIF